MRYLLFSLSFFAVSVHAEFDFSQAYLLPSVDASKLDIGGAIEITDDRLNYYALRFGSDAEQQLTLLERFPQGQFFLAGLSLADLNTVLEAIPEPNTISQQLAPQLQNTRWEGNYQTTRNLYRTTLTFKLVTDTFALANVEHASIDPEQSTLLNVDIAGALTTQFNYDDPNDDSEELVWKNSDEYYALIEDLLEERLVEQERLEEGETLDPFSFPDIQAQRFTMRLKRLDASIYRHANGNWGRNAEYRITVEGNTLFGNVGNPPDNFSNDDSLSQSSFLELTLVAE